MNKVINDPIKPIMYMLVRCSPQIYGSLQEAFNYLKSILWHTQLHVDENIRIDCMYKHGSYLCNLFDKDDRVVGSIFFAWITVKDGRIRFVAEILGDD